MSNTEQQVRSYYDSAGPAYLELMGTTWHHGDLAAHQRGLNPTEAAQDLERQLVTAAGLAPGQRALDFGAGVGGAVVYMAGITGAHWTGVSNNAWLTAQARRLAAEAGLEATVSFETIADEDYKTLSAWPDAAFDCVTWFESVCHLPDKAAFFRAAHRIIKPGGHLLGVDWLQRPFGPHRTPDQIARWMKPVEDAICIPWHGTVDSYRALIIDAGFEVLRAEDMYPGVPCWGSTPTEERPSWLTYDGLDGARIQAGKQALDAAREAGVFTVGRFMAQKPW
jgi:cyclopropane fatty-acyl-phospholipid synthase-like methyltransferase